MTSIMLSWDKFVWWWENGIWKSFSNLILGSFEEVGSAQVVLFVLALGSVFTVCCLTYISYVVGQVHQFQDTPALSYGMAEMFR